MEKIGFRYKSHPGDLLRNTDIRELPDPINNLDDFLTWLLDNYQSDSRITYLDDLYKLLDGEFYEEADRLKFIDEYGEKTEKQIQKEIDLLEEELRQEGYHNFYRLVMEERIEIVTMI